MATKLSEMQKRSIEINVDDQLLYLRYDLNALAVLEEKYGDVDKAFNFEQDSSKIISKLRFVLHTGLQANQPEMSIEDVGSLFTLENLQEFQEAVGGAVEQAMPDEKKDESKNVKTPKDHLTKKAASSKAQKK